MEAEGELARLREENVSLRRLLEAPLSADWNFLPARVIGVYQHGWWMNQGRRNGVTEGMVVLVEGHLAGLVNLVEERRARVVAIDSDQHKLEVVIRSQQTSEVTGQGVLTKRGDRLVVEQILPVDEVYSGDLVLTKGSDQVLPDVPIGVISSVIQTEETALYQQVEVWWPVNRLAVDRLVVVYGW
jgi:cell shape-determining protein MreC